MEQHYITRFILLAVFSIFAQITSAQVYVKHDAVGNSDGTSWANAYESVEKALSNVTSGEIWVAAGTYKPGGATPDNLSVFNITGNIALYGGFNGTETMLSQRNPPANVTTLSGDLNDDDIVGDFSQNKSDNTVHVIVVDAGLTNIVIDGFVINGGHTGDDNSQEGYFWQGGGIYTESPITVNQCRFTNNFGRSGGSIYIPASASGSEVTNTVFTSNATSSQSSGIFVTGVNEFSMSGCTFSLNQTIRGAFYVLNSDNVTIDDCVFENNTNTDGPGGAMWNFNSTNVSISDTEFKNNKALNAGAIYYSGGDLMNMEGAENFVLTDCIFTDNSTTDNAGGAMRNNDGSYTLDGCVFQGNSSIGSGGHIRNDTDGDEVVYIDCHFEDGETSGNGYGGAHTCYGLGNYTILNCEYEGNTTPNFGGSCNIGFGATALFDGCTFYENSSTGSVGGAIALQNDMTALTVKNSDFFNNTASSSGGAIWTGSTESSNNVVVDNCEFWQNASEGFGGAINTVERGPGEGLLTINNSLFAFNSSSDQGGAISMVDMDGSITSSVFFVNFANGDGTGGAISINASDSNDVVVNVLNSTFADNVGSLSSGIAQWTGDIQASLTTTVQNSIFRQEGDINYAVEGGTPVFISNGGNMSDDGTLQDVFTEPTDYNFEEPEFEDPGDFNYALSVSSLGIDAGVSAGTPEFDILGNPRINLPDIGAYENQEVTSTKETLLENKGMLAISPNPVRGTTAQATLSNDWTGELQVLVTDLAGRLALEMKIDKTSPEYRFEISLQNVEKGIYHVAVSNGEYSVMERLLKI